MSHTPILFFMLVDSSLFKVLHQCLSVSFKTTFDSFDSLISTIPNLVTCNRYQSFIVRYQNDTTLELFKGLKWYWDIEKRERFGGSSGWCTLVQFWKTPWAPVGRFSVSIHAWYFIGRNSIIYSTNHYLTRLDRVGGIKSFSNKNHPMESCINVWSRWNKELTLPLPKQQRFQRQDG